MIKVHMVGISPNEETIESTLTVTEKKYGAFNRRGCVLITGVDFQSLRKIVYAYQLGYILYERSTMKRVILND